MVQRPRYAEVSGYEEKLKRVMNRLWVKEYSSNYDSEGGCIEFIYKNEKYRFEHSITKAKAKNIDLEDGSAAFIQLVLALEDLARLAERGIYDLQSWIKGMKMVSAVPRE